MQIVFGCKYGFGRGSKCTGIRPNQHTVKNNCQAVVRFYCRGTNTSRKVCVLTTYSEEHNHPATEEMFQQDTDQIGKEEEAVLKDMIDSNVKVRQIKNVFRRKKGLKLTDKHIRYKMSKLMGPDKDEEELAKFLQEVEEEGGSVSILYNEDGTVRVLTVTTEEMKKALLGSDPSILHCDTTFKFESSGYKLTSFLYLNPVTGKGEVGQLSFISDEGTEAYTFAFSAFRRILSRDPRVIMVDKDFHEIKILNEVFKTTTILLCWFHVVKWWKTLIATAKVDLEVKAEIHGSFRKLMYARNSEQFEESLADFYKFIEVNKYNVHLSYLS